MIIVGSSIIVVIILYIYFTCCQWNVQEFVNIEPITDEHENLPKATEINGFKIKISCYK